MSRLRDKLGVYIEWKREGKGWVGRWSNSDGIYGAFGDISVYPEGGLHPAWIWETPWGKGGSCTFQEAKQRALALTSVC